MIPAVEPQLTKRFGVKDSHTLKVYLETGGYGSLHNLFALQPEQVVEEVRRYLAAQVPVGQHLADQLMLPLGIGAHLGSGGGVFRTMGLSLHSTTHMEILRRFLEISIQVDREDGGNCLVRLGYGPK